MNVSALVLLAIMLAIAVPLAIVFGRKAKQAIRRYKTEQKNMSPEEKRYLWAMIGLFSALTIIPVLMGIVVFTGTLAG